MKRKNTGQPEKPKDTSKPDAAPMLKISRKRALREGRSEFGQSVKISDTMKIVRPSRQSKDGNDDGKS